MFCSKCGLEQSCAAAFCFNCGESLKTAEKRPTMDLKDFMVSKKKARTTSNKIKKTTMVSIYCSLMKEGLKQDRGTRLPVLVDITWGPAALKKAIYDKMGRYHRHILDFRMSDYDLIYKTGETIL